MMRSIRNFQHGIAAWMRWCFLPDVVTDIAERTHRFFEEAGELCQALNMSEREAHQLVRYTWNRPKGEPGQEVGGVMVTLAALCGPTNLDLETEAWTEYDRITQEDVMLRIRQKQAAKPKFGALPQTYLPVMHDDEITATHMALSTGDHRANSHFVMGDEYPIERDSAVDFMNRLRDLGYTIVPC